MRRPPSLKSLPRYPAVGGVGLLAVLATGAWWAGADISPLVMNVRAWHGEPWRLISSALPHVNLIHLAFNLYWLWVFGTAVEYAFGSARTIGLFCLFGLSSAAAEYAVFRGGVGLSGVGYGLFGFLWMMSRKDLRFRDCVDRSTIRLFVGWFFLCIALSYAGVWRIANVAHASGAGIGCLVGLACTARGVRRRIFAGLVPASVLVTVAAATVGRPYVNLSSNADEALAHRAYRALEDGDNERGVELLHRAIALNEGRAGSWYNLGLAYGRMDRNREAVDAFRRAAELEPFNREFKETLALYRGCLASVLQLAGQHGEAAELLREALAADDGDAGNWYDLGLCCERLGRTEEAKEAYRRAVQLDPTDEDYSSALSSLEGDGSRAPPE